MQGDVSGLQSVLVEADGEAGHHRAWRRTKHVVVDGAGLMSATVRIHGAAV